jgi:hypothetical protein
MSRITNAFVRALQVVALCVLSAAAVAGETFDAPDQAFEKVFEVPGHSRDEIFTSSKIWVAENFRSSKAVLEYESKDDGVLIGNGIIDFPCKGAFDCLAKADWKVRFTMRIDMKDDKFRLTFSNVHLAWPAAYRSGISSPAYDGPVNSKKDRAKIQAALLALGPRLQAQMSGASPANDDW